MMSTVALLAAAILSGLALAQPLQEPELRAVTPCGQHTINPGDTLNIQSARYPKKYPANENCEWEIGCSSSKATIDLTCSAFKVVKAKKCSADYLSMSDSNKNYIKACGTKPPKGVVSEENQVTIKFVSNEDKKRATGFDCTVTCLAPPTTTPKPTTTSTTTTTTEVPLESTTAEDSKATAESKPSCECGKSVSLSRILGGGDADRNEYPWQVAITPKRLGIPFCSATLLNSEYVVTAAHCVDSIPVEHYDLVFGEHDWLKIGRTFKRTASEVIVHPAFDKSTLDNDIALVKLNLPVSIFAHADIIPVCLPSSDTNFESKSGVATGWGIIADGGHASSALQEVDLDIMNQADCEAAYPKTITDNMLCAGGDGSDVCQGDDGGPLVVDIDGSYVLVGITSQGDCARTNKPGVFTNVQSQLDWIKSELKSGRFCPVASTTAAPTTEASEGTTNEQTTKVTTAKPTTAKPTTEAPTTQKVTKPATSLPGLQCACGVVEDKSGDAHSLTSNPWTLNLYSGNTLFCSATYINTMNVLTAANCVNGRGLNFMVRGNEETFGTGLPRAISRTPTNVIVNGDLAIVSLNAAFSMTAYDTIKPACLPYFNPYLVNYRATQSGYDSGRVKAKGGYWSENPVAKRIRFNPDGGASGAYCGEDLGGPIVTEYNGRIHLAGIGIGIGCAYEQDAANIGSYYQWIFDNTQNGRFCSL